jgi:hypothetical protein
METIRRKCKDSQGGIKRLWLFPYVQYNRSQIVVSGKTLVTFPSTDIFEINPLTITQSEKQEEDAGGKYWNQTIGFTIPKFDFEFQKLIKKDYRIIVEDNNGKYIIYGLYKGLECNKIDFASGNSKSDSNGMSFSFDGKEEVSSFFIDNLEDAGFGGLSYLLQEDGFYLLQEDGFKIIL